MEQGPRWDQERWFPRKVGFRTGQASEGDSRSEIVAVNE